MQRRLCAAILLLESVVLGLSSAVLTTVEGVDKPAALGLGLGLAVACLVVSALLRFRWSYALGWAIQVGAFALGFLTAAMFALGAIFLVLWLTAVRLGRTIDRDRAAAEAGSPTHE
jgi:hypothetical protein